MYVTEPTCISVEAAPRPPCLPRPHPSFPSQATGHAQYAGVRRGRWRLQPVHMDMDARKEKEFDIACIPAPGQAPQGPHTYIHTYIHTYHTSSARVLPVTRYSDTSDPTTSHPTVLPNKPAGRTAVVSDVHVPSRSCATPAFSQGRSATIAPRSTDSKTQESLTHPIRVAFSTEDEYACGSLSQTDVLSVGKISAGQGPLPSHTSR